MNDKETRKTLKALNKQCTRICKAGKCNIECIAIGYCSEVWAAYWKNQNRRENSTFYKLVFKVKGFFE